MTFRLVLYKSFSLRKSDAQIKETDELKKPRFGENTSTTFHCTDMGMVQGIVPLKFVSVRNRRRFMMTCGW